MLSVNGGSFTSSSPAWVLSAAFSYPAALTRPSSKMLKGSGKNRHPCLVLISRGKQDSALKPGR